MELTIEGVYPGLSEQKLLEAGWVLEQVRERFLTYHHGGSGAIVREGKVFEVFGESVYKGNSEVLHIGMHVSPSRIEVIERLGISAQVERPLVSAHRPERLNFEGIGLVILVEDSSIVGLMLNAKLLQFGNERTRVAGWWYVVKNPPAPQNSPG